MKSRMMFKSNKAALLREFDARIGECLELLGLEWQKSAKKEVSKHSVDTGELRDSLSFFVKENEIIVGAGVDYAVFVNNGTRFMAGRRFMQDSVSGYVEEYRKVVESAMKFKRKES